MSKNVTHSLTLTLTLTLTLSLAEKELNKLKVSGRPIVNTNKLDKIEIFDVSRLTKEEHIKFLSGDYELFYSSDYDGNVFLNISKPESEEQQSSRIAGEQLKQKKYDERFEELCCFITGEKQRIENEKQESNKKYQDPEYIEFLRIQSKMKQRGLI